MLRVFGHLIQMMRCGIFELTFRCGFGLLVDAEKWSDRTIGGGKHILHLGQTESLEARGQTAVGRISKVIFQR